MSRAPHRDDGRKTIPAATNEALGGRRYGFRLMQDQHGHREAKFTPMIAAARKDQATSERSHLRQLDGIEHGGLTDQRRATGYIEEQWIGAFVLDGADQETELAAYRWIGRKAAQVGSGFIYISPAHRRRGLATAMLAWSIVHEPEDWRHLPHLATISASNEGSKRLYHSLHFRPRFTPPPGYDVPVDWIRPGRSTQQWRDDLRRNQLSPPGQPIAGRLDLKDYFTRAMLLHRAISAFSNLNLRMRR